MEKTTFKPIEWRALSVCAAALSVTQGNIDSSPTCTLPVPLKTYHYAQVDRPSQYSFEPWRAPNVSQFTCFLIHGVRDRPTYRAPSAHRLTGNSPRNDQRRHCPDSSLSQSLICHQSLAISTFRRLFDWPTLKIPAITSVQHPSNFPPSPPCHSSPTCHPERSVDSFCCQLLGLYSLHQSQSGPD
jgi:hypothetical protein